MGVLLVFLGIGIVVAVIFIQKFIADIVRDAAIDKGYGGCYLHVWALTFWLGIVGILIVCCLPDLRTRKILENDMNSRHLCDNGESSKKVNDENLPDL